MTLDEFQDLLDTHGGDPDMWPPAMRDAALLLLETNDNALLLHEEAMMLDNVLQGEPAPAPSADALTSLFDDVARHAEAEENRTSAPLLPETEPVQPELSWGDRLLDIIFRPAYTLGASAALGVVFGIWDIWLEPVSDPSFISEFVYSALPL